MKWRKQSCRPPQGARCCIQGQHDRPRIGVESRRPRASAACSGMEMVGYMEPCWVGWSETVAHASVWRVTSQGWPQRSGTRRSCVAKAVCECGMLGNVRDELH